MSLLGVVCFRRLIGFAQVRLFVLLDWFALIVVMVTVTYWFCSLILSLFVVCGAFHVYEICWYTFAWDFVRFAYCMTFRGFDFWACLCDGLLYCCGLAIVLGLFVLFVVFSCLLASYVDWTKVVGWFGV